MLAVFNLNWPFYDVHEKIKQASESLDEAVEARQAGHYVQFDLASLGAGEKIFYKSTPEEKRVPTPILDEIRQCHAKLVAGLRHDKAYNNYHDLAETLAAVRSHGIDLAAVYNGSAADTDQALKSAYLRDYFETRVYSTKTYGRRVEIDTDFYALVMDENNADPRHTLVVDSTVDGILAGHSAGGHVLAYIQPEENNLPPVYKDMKVAMEQIGVTADRLVTTTRDIRTAAICMAAFSPKKERPPLALL